jgi:two-component system, sensor histidine kinase and response regulator
LKLQFLTNISHSIRTPVSAILNMAYLALKSDLSTRQREYLQVIDQCGHHLRGLVNQVLDFSKMEAGMLQLQHASFELSTVLNQVLAMSAPAATAKGISLSLEVSPGTPEHLVGDPLRLTEVLLNFVSNGTKFTDHGGVRVQVACIAKTPERVQLKLSVSDTGRGLTAVQLQQLFKRFSQIGNSDSSPVGSGLGLEIAKMLVNLMGGDVGARSTPGAGSVFWCTPWFSLPAPETPKAPKLPAVSPP